MQFLTKNTPASTKTPPMVSGALPVVGHALEMMNNREKLFERGYAEHGRIFTISLGNQNAVVVGDKAHNRIFYSETDKKLNISEVYDFLHAAIGEVLFTAGLQVYNNQRPVLLAIFKRERMEQYLQAMNHEVGRWLQELGETGEMNITFEMQRLTQFVAAHAFLGASFREELDDAFWDAYTDIAKSLDMVLPAHLPLPKFRRRDRARRYIRQTFARLALQRRQQMDAYDDLITLLLTTPQKDGSFMQHDDIATMFTGLMFAGHETTAGQAAWTVIQLLQHPDYLARVMAEIDEVLQDDAPIGAQQLHDLKHLYWAIDETTRMRPSADVQMRLVEEPVQFDGYEIPVGWRVIVSQVVAHYDPDTFTHAEVYDPLRHAPDRNEAGNPFSIIGFGGGIHKCTGMNFAKNEMAIITAQLLRHYDLTLLTHNPQVVTGVGANRPADTLIRYRRKTS